MRIVIDGTPGYVRRVELHAETRGDEDIVHALAMRDSHVGITVSATKSLVPEAFGGDGDTRTLYADLSSTPPHMIAFEMPPTGYARGF